MRPFKNHDPWPWYRFDRGLAKDRSQPTSVRGQSRLENRDHSASRGSFLRPVSTSPRDRLGLSRGFAIALLVVWGVSTLLLSQLRSGAATPVPPATGLPCETSWLTPITPSSGSLRDGELELEIRDKQTGRPIAARVVILDDKNRPKRIPSLVREGDHAYAFYEIVMKLPEGDYTYELDAGAEYRPLTGNFSIRANDAARQVIEVERAVDLASENWAVIEQGVFKARDEADVIVAATQARHAGALCGPFPERRGRREFATLSDPPHTFFAWHPLQWGDVRLILWDPSLDPFDEANASPNVAWPSDVDSLVQWKAADNRRRILIDSPLAESLPLWASLGLLDGVTLLGAFESNEAERMPNSGYDIAAADARDAERRLRATIQKYQQLLAADLYLPPTALSRWDVDQRPLGIHRTMTAMEIDSRPVAPWDALTAGHTWISSGPLVRFTAAGAIPGTMFHQGIGQTQRLDLGFRVTSRYRLDKIELYQTGQLIRQFTLKEVAASGEAIRIDFASSGWLLPVAWAQDEAGPRVAIAAPFRVLIGGEPYIDPRAVQTQITALEQLEQKWLADQTHGVRAEHFERARDFWTQKLP